MSEEVVNIEKVGTAAKLTYDDGSVLYTWANGRYLVNADNDNVEAVNTAVPEDDHFRKWKYQWSNLTEKFGTMDAKTYCEYLIRNDIFFFNVPSVLVQDNTSLGVIEPFNLVTNNTTLADPVAVNDSTIEVVSATGISIGSFIVIFSPVLVIFTSFGVTGVSGTTITLDSPMDIPYPAGSFVDVGVTDMAVDGSSAPVTFGLRGVGGAPAGISLTLHVTKLVITVITATPVSLPLFGDIAALAKGVVVRWRNGANKNYVNIKTNQDIANIMAWIPYDKTGKPLEGEDGFRAEFILTIDAGNVVELPVGEDLEFIIQDNLLAITSIKAFAIGHLI